MSVSVCVCLCELAQSDQRRVTGICRCSLSNVARRARWQPGWTRRVLKRQRAVMKPSSPKTGAASLSAELVRVFRTPSLVCSLFTSSLFEPISVWSPSFLSSILIISPFCVSLYLSTSSCLHLFDKHWIICSLSASICLPITGFLVYRSSQEAVVWDIPVFTVIDSGLSSFIGALLSCKTAQGSFFFSLWEPIYWWHLFRSDLLWVCLSRDTQRYLPSQGNPTIIVAWFKHLSFSFFLSLYTSPRYNERMFTSPSIKAVSSNCDFDSGASARSRTPAVWLPSLFAVIKWMSCLNLRWLIN